jgi:hypothetical protein
MSTKGSTAMDLSDATTTIAGDGDEEGAVAVGEVV